MAAVSDGVLQYPFVEDDALDVDPYFRELQRRTPVLVQMPYGPPAWLATRYEDVRRIFCDRRFSRVRPEGTDAPGATRGANMVNTTLPLGMDPPQHNRVRRVTAPVFSPKVIRTMRDDLQQVVDRLLDGMAERGPGADFTASFAWDLPINALTLLLGVPTSDADSFREWVETSTNELAPEAERMEAMARTSQYIEELIAQRRAQRHDDLLGVLVEACDDDRITEAELRGLIQSLVVGGFETTATQLGSSVYTLMTHRDHWQELVDGRAEMDAALEELWRWIPAFRYGTMFVRWAHDDVELTDGFVIRAGAAIVPEQPVANRDEAVFPHGWELDFHRVDPRPHLALGFGEHLCMGLHLAKLQVELTVRSLVERFPTLELAVPAREVEWPKWMFMRTVGAMPLTW
jgi:cytochrome P450